MENKSKHTPGPWNVMHGKTLYHVETDMVCQPAGKHICSIPGTLEGWNNARLIAAAPELLAALEEMVMMVEDGAFSQPSFDKAHAAIAKAKAKGE